VFIIPSPKPKYEIHRVTPISKVYTGMIGYSIFAWLPYPRTYEVLLTPFFFFLSFLAIEQGNPCAKRMMKGPDSRKP
jgi:hypothetical protein